MRNASSGNTAVHIQKILRQLISEDSGATAIEYGLIVALIVVAIIAGINSVSMENSEMYNTISTTLEGI